MSHVESSTPRSRPARRARPAVATRTPAQCSLCALRMRQPATIHSMANAEPGQVRYLATLGLLPQAAIQVEERAPFRGPLLVKVGGARYALGRDVADGIIVTPA